MLTRTLPVLLVLATGGTHALTPVPPQPDQELLPLLYETLDGDNWHRNDGWLDEAVHWCDWYGITCGEEYWPGLFRFEALDLPDNNLSGELSEELAWLLFAHVSPRTRIDFSNNDISGELAAFPAGTRQVDLSDNSLAGALPEVDTNVVHVDDKHLRLARNRFEGAVPESWDQLRLRELDLTDNRLETGFLNAFRAMSRDSKVFLNLGGNQFSGELTVDIKVANLNENDSGNAGGGLNLCFNDFILADEALSHWVARRHAGGPDFEDCLGRERTDMDAGISGSWFNPDFDGEGVTLQLLDTGAPLLYSFSFDRQGRQQWLFEVGLPAPQSFLWQPLLETRGDFGQGIRHDGDVPMMRGISRVRFDRLDNDTVHLERNYYDLAACGPFLPIDPDQPAPPGICTPELFSDRLDYQRLTELAGTDCDNQSEFQQYSGAWYNPEAAGEGFIIEVLPDDRALIYWFTYAADHSGEQAWMTGVGRIGIPPTIGITVPPASGTPLEIETLWQPVGATYGPDFDPTDVERIDWGWLGIEFQDVDSGHVHFESHLEDFGTGDFPIERLARPKLATCEQD